MHSARVGANRACPEGRRQILPPIASRTSFATREEIIIVIIINIGAGQDEPICRFMQYCLLRAQLSVGIADSKKPSQVELANDDVEG